MPNEDERAADEVVARTLGRFDPRWFPVALTTGTGRAGLPATGPVVASRLEELLAFYRCERRRIRSYARHVLDDDGRAADDLVLRAFRRLCQDPPAFPGGPGPVVRAAIRAESASRDARTPNGSPQEES
jgi:hypothetical protein